MADHTIEPATPDEIMQRHYDMVSEHMPLLLDLIIKVETANHAVKTLRNGVASQDTVFMAAQRARRIRRELDAEIERHLGRYGRLLDAMHQHFPEKYQQELAKLEQ